MCKYKVTDPVLRKHTYTGETWIKIYTIYLHCFAILFKASQQTSRFEYIMLLAHTHRHTHSMNSWRTHQRSHITTSILFESMQIDMILKMTIARVAAATSSSSTTTPLARCMYWLWLKNIILPSISFAKCCSALWGNRFDFSCFFSLVVSCCCYSNNAVYLRVRANLMLCTFPSKRIVSIFI